MKIVETKEEKRIISENYNHRFFKKTGVSFRWGKTVNDDPLYCPYGPEILDLEISSGGDCLGNCPFCYKCNGGDQPTYNMSFEQFKTIFDKMPKTLTQIAFGIMNIHTNPDFFKMMEYSRKNGVIPNYTTHGLDVSDEDVERTAKLCGAVAVSIVNKEKTYEAIRKYTEAGMTQVNMHYLLSEETYDNAFDIVEDISSDTRLKDFNAIVFLQYKSKGRHPESFHSVLDVDKYAELISYCNYLNVSYGFDSCSAPIFMKSIKDFKHKKRLEMCAESCESFGMFSSYINCHGTYFPCSFCEGEDGWTEGIDVLNCKDFLKDIWFSEKINYWRNKMIENSVDGCRNCPIFSLAPVES